MNDERDWRAFCSVCCHEAGEHAVRVCRHMLGWGEMQGEVPEAEGVTSTLPSQQWSWDHVAVDNGGRHKAKSKLGLPRSHGASDMSQVLVQRNFGGLRASEPKCQPVRTSLCLQGTRIQKVSQKFCSAGSWAHKPWTRVGHRSDTQDWSRFLVSKFTQHLHMWFGKQCFWTIVG